MSLTICYRGNFSVPYSTESHIAASLESLSHTVIRCQENHVDWPTQIQACKGADLFLWTSTFDYAHHWDQPQAHEAVRTLNDMLPTAACHLDRFWGLDREGQIATEPWFRLRTVATADGGHDYWWAEAGVNHAWFPPGVYHEEAYPGTYTGQLARDIVFVGNWRGGYHREWPHRQELINHLRRRWGRRVAFWPIKRAIRGQQLQDLYASVKVAVGDSCLVACKDGRPITRFCSDRLPETIGRGCLLIHPEVEGVTDGGLYTSGEHLLTWSLGNWAALDRVIEQALDDQTGREEIVRRGHAHVLAHHTYKVRMEWLLTRILG